MSEIKKSLLDTLLRPFCWCNRKLKGFWNWYKSLYKGLPWWKKTIVALSSFIAFLIFYIFAVIFNLFWLFGKSPSLNEIMHPKTAMASEIYSADGKVIGKFFSENRMPVEYKDINPVFFKALISTEDERFYKHHGVDFQGMLAAAKDATRGNARGASTITQQLVKNMFKVRSEYGTGLLGKIPGVRILIMKSKEMIIATEIEMTNSKQDILRMYANTVDFGSNAFGIKTAAKTYFNTTPAKLKPEEAAVLVGMLKATTAYNPRTNPERSKSRRNVVLENMYTHNFLSRQEADSLKKLPLKLDFSVESALDGQALYFRDAVADYIKEKCPDLDPYTDGLKIYTTLDTRMQKYAEEAVTQQMKTVQNNFDNHWRGQDPWRDERGNIIPNFIEDRLKKENTYKQLVARYPNDPDSVTYFLNKPHKVKLFTYNGPEERIMSTVDSLKYMVRFMHAGFMAMEPQTGYVRAWVGDIDYKTWQYDKVVSMRQPGSTFKLFVYATAMKQGLTPADTRRDEMIEMTVYDKVKKENTVWRPTNANGRFSGIDMPIRAAFARSINSVAVRLGQEVGIPEIIRTAQDLGVKSPLDDAPALTLGASDVKLEEIVGAYSAVANYGAYIEPTLVTKIVNQDGDVVYETEAKPVQALPWKAAFYMQKILEAGMTDSGGTSQSFQSYLGSALWNKKIDAGGKTGTSNNHSDAWFVGVTPGLVCGAWVGAEDRCIHFRTGALGQGSRTALPIVGLFMQKVLADAELGQKYRQRYAPTPEVVDPATYGGDFNFSAPSDNLADSLSSHQSDSLDSSADDLMGGGGEPLEEPAVTPRPEEVQSSSSRTVISSQKTGTQKVKKEKDSGEDLFN
ncbi:transglycosylase domain-containing protein [Alloprevotella rava]|uniref:Penicillin-binding protein 1A n=1 Tax=Alloprevotella rava TaxID=671218 RepID=A0A7W5UHT0_9BACT|nr:transglycosylase domain-containing protein [Alloprevotella rava]MBB3701608.1 penicillin-binding protein 1A [Alloprevotella rava]